MKQVTPLQKMKKNTTDDVSTEMMLKRVFNVARILATAQHHRSADREIAKNRVENQDSHRLS